MISFVVPFFVVVALLAAIALLTSERGKGTREYVKFVLSGLDSGFGLSQIILLGKVGREAGLEDLAALFVSLPALDRCIAEIVRRSRQTGTQNSAEKQEFLSRLYSYRTRLELDHSQKKRGLESTKEIDSGQRVRVLLRGVGVFSSKVLRVNAKNLALEYPVSSNGSSATAIDWENRTLSVYFWRQNDAGYVFDTVTVPDPASVGKAILHVAHSHNLIRSQKRKSVRAKCSIFAQLYLIRPEDTVDDSLEPEPGMKCLVEDVSQDGAMLVIGGKAIKDMRIKIQFMIHEVLIVMPGTIRAVEFNPETNQSRIHFESGELNQRMKNAILTYVYNVLPEEKREELDAIRLSEQDGLESEEGSEGEVVQELPAMPDFLEPSGKPSGIAP